MFFKISFELKLALGDKSIAISDCPFGESMSLPSLILPECLQHHYSDWGRNTKMPHGLCMSIAFVDVRFFFILFQESADQ